MYAYEKRSGNNVNNQINKNQITPKHNPQPIQRVLIIGKGRNPLIWNDQTPSDAYDDLFELIEQKIRALNPSPARPDLLFEKAKKLFEDYKNSQYYEGRYTNTSALADALINMTMEKRLPPTLVDQELVKLVCSCIINGTGSLSNMAHLLYKYPNLFFDVKDPKFKKLQEFISDPVRVIYRLLEQLLKPPAEFWGIQAIIDEVSKKIFALFPEVTGENRPSLPYAVDYPAAFDGALHHRTPWSELSKDKTVTDRAALCWKESNLVAGPRQERIYDPGSSFDIEADIVWTYSQAALPTKTIPSHHQESVSRPEVIRTESKAFHMRTSWLQRIYSDTCRIIQLFVKNEEKLNSEDPGIQYITKHAIMEQVTELRNSIQIAEKRFQTIETEFSPYVRHLQDIQKELHKLNSPEAISSSLPLILETFKRCIQEQGQKLAQQQDEAQRLKLARRMERTRWVSTLEPDTGQEQVASASSQSASSSASLSPLPQHDDLDMDTMLPFRTVQAIRQFFHTRDIFNPPSTGNNCFFAALTRNPKQAQRYRTELRGLLGGGLADGTMVDYFDLLAMFQPRNHQPSPAQTLFGITGVHMYELVGDQILHVADFGTTDYFSPIILCIESVHYIRIG